MLFTYTICTLWWIHAELRHNASATTPEWHQPSTSNIFFPKKISPQIWPLDFELAEQVLSESKLNNNGELLINPQLADTLDKAIALLPENLNENTLQRAKFLTSKILTDRSGDQLASVFINYYQLQKKIKKDNLIEKDDSNVESELSIFRRMTAIQDQFLGNEIANLLFGKKRSITEYLYERRDINGNIDLNSNQKKRQLNALKIKYRNKISTSSGQKND
jgi:hypothetical protein